MFTNKLNVVNASLVDSCVEKWNHAEQSNEFSHNIYHQYVFWICQYPDQGQWTKSGSFSITLLCRNSLHSFAFLCTNLCCLPRPSSLERSDERRIRFFKIHQFSFVLCRYKPTFDEKMRKSVSLNTNFVLQIQYCRFVLWNIQMWIYLLWTNLQLVYFFCHVTKPYPRVSILKHM